MERFFAKPIVQMIHPCQLQPHPRNSEFFDDIEGDKWNEFVASIDADGIWTPIVTDMDGTIISGTQRWRAARKLGFTEVPVIERRYESEDDKLLELIKSNTQQRFSGNNEIKTAKCFKEIRRICGINEGGDHVEGPPAKIAGGPSTPTTKELGEMCGLKPRQVQNIMRLLELAPELQDAVESGEITASAASLILSKLPKETQKELVTTVGLGVLGDMTMKELKEVVPQLNEFEKETQKWQDKAAELEAALEKQPGEVFSENELDEAHAKIEKLEADKRQYYERLQAERSAHKAEIKELSDQYEEDRKRTVEVSEHLATLARIQKDTESLGKLDLEMLKRLADPIKNAYQSVSDLMDRAGLL